MAPEQATGEPVTPATDLHALGVVAFQLFSGRLPFEETDDADGAALPQGQRALPAAARRADPRLAELIARLLAREPADRPQSAREVQGRARGDRGRAARAVLAARGAPRGARRRRRGPAAAAVRGWRYARARRSALADRALRGDPGRRDRRRGRDRDQRDRAARPRTRWSQRRTRRSAARHRDPARPTRPRCRALTRDESALTDYVQSRLGPEGQCELVDATPPQARRRPRALHAPGPFRHDVHPLQGPRRAEVLPRVPAADRASPRASAPAPPTASGGRPTRPSRSRAS